MNQNQNSIFAKYLFYKTEDEMMSTIKYLLYFLVMLFLTFSCKPGTVKESEKETERVRRSFTPNPIIWDTLSVDTVQPFAMTGLETEIRLKLNIKTLREYESLNILQKINKEILLQILGDDYADTAYTEQENFAKYITNYLADYATKMKRYGESKYKTSSFEKLVHLYDLKTEILYNEANLVSYQISIEENIGRDSLHSILVKNLLFDLTDARLLTEDDIFGDNYSDQLNQRLVIQSLIDHKQDSIQQLQSLGYWGIADLEANSNFYVDRNAIKYTFNPGEYADKDKGILKISVDFDSLQYILKKDSPISILINE